MKTMIAMTALGAGAVVASTLVTAAGAAPAGKAAPAWSPAVDGVHARFVVASTTDDKHREQIEIALEIENTSDVDGGIPMAWGYVGDMLALTVEDAAGKPLTGAGVGGSYASGPPYVVNLPAGSTLRVPVSKAAMEYVSATKTMFRPLTFQAWVLAAKHGPLYLRATLKPHPRDASEPALGSRAWTHPLELPRVLLP